MGTEIDASGGTQVIMWSETWKAQRKESVASSLNISTNLGKCLGRPSSVGLTPKEKQS